MYTEDINGNMEMWSSADRVLNTRVFVRVQHPILDPHMQTQGHLTDVAE